jgi:flagellar motor switch protein FliN/FliY
MAGTDSAGAETRDVTDLPAEFTDFLDVPMQITLELGRRTTRVREILTLKPESVLEVPKSAGENIDVYINGRLLAYGEILETEGRAAVRLTDFNVQI